MNVCDCREKNRLEIPSQGARVGEVRAFVGEVAKNCGFTEEEVFDVKLAVSEACANAIEHGSPRGSNNCVYVECHCNEDDLLISIKDEGVFKRNLVYGTNGIRGRGIFLMLALMDKVTIDESRRGTTVNLVKRYNGFNGNGPCC